MYNINIIINILSQQKSPGFWSLCASPQTGALAFLTVFLFCDETMSNCSQNCWIDWNSAALCFKWLFHIEVWTFARCVRPLLPTILCGCEIWSPRISRICLLAKKKLKKKNKKKKGKKVRHRTDFEDDWWPETGDFFGLITQQTYLKAFMFNSVLNVLLK